MPSKDFSKRICPICQNPDIKMLYHQSFSEISEGSLLSGYDVVVCQKCGFGFSDNIPLQIVFDAYYKNMSKYENRENLNQPNNYDWMRFKIIVEELKPFIFSPQTSILEIGCATGGLLSLLKSLGQTSLFGLDPSPTCAMIAFDQHQIHVEIGSLFDNCIQNSFDFIILIGVLEHIRDLQTCITILEKLLNKTGRIYVEVPDVLHFVDWPDAPFQQFSTEHINFFSPVSLQNLLNRNGFKTLYCTQTVREQSFRSMMPVIGAIFEKKLVVSIPLITDYETECAIQDYIQSSKDVDKYIGEIINNIVQSQFPIYVWGVGTHTQRLLVESVLGQACIVAFIDSNPNYHEKKLMSIPIESPHSIINHPKIPILISSKVFQKEIEDAIRLKYNLPNPLIRLYREQN